MEDLNPFAALEVESTSSDEWEAVGSPELDITTKRTGSTNLQAIDPQYQKTSDNTLATAGKRLLSTTLSAGSERWLIIVSVGGDGTEARVFMDPDGRIAELLEHVRGQTGARGTLFGDAGELHATATVRISGLSDQAKVHCAIEKDYVDCSDADSDDGGEVFIEEVFEKCNYITKDPLDGSNAVWFYALRKYVRRDDAESLLGLLRQCNISLDCRPCFSEDHNGEPTSLTLDRLDGWSHAVSIRDFVNGTPGIDGQVLECLADRGVTACQAAILDYTHEGNSRYLS